MRSVNETPDQIQDGIYFRRHERPPPAYLLLLLNVIKGAGRSVVAAALEETMAMLGALKEGAPRELDGIGEAEREVNLETFVDLDALIGFGRRLFDPQAHEPPLTNCLRPDALVYLAQDSPFPALPWAGGGANRGEADIALQLTGRSEAAVNRAAVEVAKLLSDEAAPLRPASSFAGFGRADGRGWLEFHDGVSNIASEQRLAAIAAPADPPWMAGGTYMAYLRLAVDMRAWRALNRAEQELIIGRDKLTGAPLVAAERGEDGDLVPVPRPPGTGDEALARAEHADPPQQTDPLLEASHTHRANQNRASPLAPSGQRIFRQGYDYLESIDEDGPELGLNFVSFQRDLSLLQHVLHLPGWLGDVNFGGPTEGAGSDLPRLELVEVVAGGFYAVPPRAEPFPGADLFTH
jgi:Dyp-type peroxidase family